MVKICESYEFLKFIKFAFSVYDVRWRADRNQRNLLHETNKQEGGTSLVLSLVPRLSTWRYPQPQLGCLQLSIDSRYAAPASLGRYLLPAPRLRQAADVDRQDGMARRTDWRTLDRYIDPEPLVPSMRAASIKEKRGKTLKVACTCKAYRPIWNCPNVMDIQMTTLGLGLLYT